MAASQGKPQATPDKASAISTSKGASASDRAHTSDNAQLRRQQGAFFPNLWPPPDITNSTYLTKTIFR